MYPVVMISYYNLQMEVNTCNCNIIITFTDHTGFSFDKPSAAGPAHIRAVCLSGESHAESQQLSGGILAW